MLINSMLSQLERETIAEHIRDNMQELAKPEVFQTGSCPVGIGYSQNNPRPLHRNRFSERRRGEKASPQDQDQAG